VKFEEIIEIGGYKYNRKIHQNMIDVLSDKTLNYRIIVENKNYLKAIGLSSEIQSLLNIIDDGEI